MHGSPIMGIRKTNLNQLRKPELTAATIARVKSEANADNKFKQESRSLLITNEAAITRMRQKMKEAESAGRKNIKAVLLGAWSNVLAFVRPIRTLHRI